jgi:type VI secretion system protein ImpA
VPLLMERAKRLATKNFMEIIQDMSPDAIQMIRTIVGAEPSAEGQSGY